MIQVIIDAKNEHDLRELLKSLSYNADKRENFTVKVNEGFENVVNEILGEQSDCEPDIIWPLTDDVIILGNDWDKRLLFFKDRFPDGILVECPFMADLKKSEIVTNYDYFPALSKKWVELCGMTSVNRICRELSAVHGIDRRIDVRLVNITERRPTRVETPSEGVVEKARKVAEYIKSFTPRG